MHLLIFNNKIKGPCVENVASAEKPATLHIEFQTHKTTIVFPTYTLKIQPGNALIVWLQTILNLVTHTLSAQPNPEAVNDLTKRKVIKERIEEIMKKGTKASL